jgi:DNA invertase Pin-like site-specific DNA recombinase
MATFGYARVSTRDQDLASQVAALQAAGCGNIFKEKASGAKTDRPELAKAIRRLEAGDVLVVTRLGWRDRPGIYSTSSMRSPKPERVSSHWPMLGPTRRPRTASYC